MRLQARCESQGRPTWTGLLGGLLCAALFFSATGQAIAGQPGREMNTPGLWAVLSAQGREVLAQGRHFVNDIRLLYQISQLEPLETEPVASPAVAPVAPPEAECKLVSAPERTAVLVKLHKARS